MLIQCNAAQITSQKGTTLEVTRTLDLIAQVDVLHLRRRGLSRTY